MICDINFHAFRIIALTSAWILAAVIVAPELIGQETTDSKPQTETKKSSDDDTDAAKSTDAKPAPPEKTRGLKVELRGDQLTFLAPVSWKAKKVSPMMKSITQHDLTVPKIQSDPKDSRLTFSLSGGGTKANIDRWKSQFRLPVGDQAADAVKIAKKKMDGYELSIVQIKGTFMDSMGGGPFAGGKKVMRPNYMMRAVILEQKGASAMSKKCFVKLVGPMASVKKHSKAFEKMIKTMKIEESTVSDE